MADARRVDINSDAGEGFGDEVLMPYLTSVNVACGGHAGDRETMAQTLGAARRHGLRAGAHPGYPDRGGFGRAELEISLEDLEASLHDQVSSLAEVAKEVGVEVTHLKAHGALYNRAWRDSLSAEIVARVALAFGPSTALFCPAGSAQEEVARSRRLSVVREVFLDRRYRADGTLVPRADMNPTIAVTRDIDAQLSFLEGLEFDTMCVHGDNPAALALLEALPPLLAARNWSAAPYPLPG